MPSRRTNNYPESGRGLGHATPTILGRTVGYPSDSLVLVSHIDGWSNVYQLLNDVCTAIGRRWGMIKIHDLSPLENQHGSRRSGAGRSTPVRSTERSVSAWWRIERLPETEMFGSRNGQLVDLDPLHKEGQYVGIAGGGGVEVLTPSSRLYRLSFWVKICFKFQCLGKISNNSTYDPQFF